MTVITGTVLRHETHGAVVAVKVRSAGEDYRVLRNRRSGEHILYRVAQTDRNQHGYNLRQVDTETEESIMKQLTLQEVTDAFEMRKVYLDDSRGLIDHAGGIEYEDVF